MRAVFLQEVEADLKGRASLVAARHEVAAARARANTAKLLAESPELRRLKELELLKEVLAGARATFVFGAGDVAEQVRSLATRTEGDR